MGSSLDLHGVYVPLVTPFTEDDRVDIQGVERLANESLEAGAAGIVALGTTGEPATLEADERRQVIETIAAVCRERNGQLIIGAGTNSTLASLTQVQEACSVEGVTAVLSVVPYYTRPSEAGIVEHFRVLAQGSTIPLVVYNIPYRTGRGLGSESLLTLAEVPNIAGLKQAVGGIDADTMRLMADKPDDFHVLCGDDPFIFPLMALGASGAIAASSHVSTRTFVDMVEHARKGDYVTARQLSDELLPLCEALFAEPSPAVTKGVLAAQGRIATAELRAPMTKASRASVERVLHLV